MAYITSADLANTRIDLADILSNRIAQAPMFISLFNQTLPSATGVGISATNTEHKWLEGVETPKTKAFTAYAYSSSTGTFTVADTTGWQVGDLFHILGDSAVLKIESVTSTTIVPSILAANGSSFALSSYTAASGGVLVFDSRPIVEASTAGESLYQQSSSASNYTQIFRGDVEISGTALAVEQAGMENDITVQLSYATDAIIRRINSALVFGSRTARSASYPGSFGGLYYWGTQTGGLSYTLGSAAALKMAHINLAANKITDAGGIPDVIVCGAGQAQVISTFQNGQVKYEKGDVERGQYVTQFVSSAGGSVMRIVVEPSIPDTDVWICDSRGFGLVPLRGRGLHTEPATAPGTDGVKAMLIGEYTAQFKNAKQTLCRISGLQASETTLLS